MAIFSGPVMVSGGVRLLESAGHSEALLSGTTTSDVDCSIPTVDSSLFSSLICDSVVGSPDPLVLGLEGESEAFCFPRSIARFFKTLLRQRIAKKPSIAMSIRPAVRHPTIKPGLKASRCPNPVTRTPVVICMVGMLVDTPLDTGMLVGVAKYVSTTFSRESQVKDVKTWPPP